MSKYSTAEQHGMTRGGKRPPEYRTWQCMRSRCENPNDPFYHRYGGRGITVCEEWHTFTKFYADMGPKPSPKHTLDRIDNDGPYTPGNCRWATYVEQAANKRNTLYLEFEGERLTAKQWAARLGITYSCLVSRLYNGWTVERALTGKRKSPAPPKPRSEPRRRCLTFQGRTQTLGEWAHETGIPYSRIRNRVRAGMPPEKVLSPEIFPGNRFKPGNCCWKGKG